MTRDKRSNQRKQRGRPSAQNDDGTHVRVRSKFNQNYALNTNTLVSSVGNIGTAVSTGILASDVNIQSLTDIFRLFKINSITFDFMPATTVGGAAVQVPSGVLGFVPYGAAGTPTSMQDFETTLVSKPTVSYPSSTTVISAPLTRECGTSLTLKNRDMPVLQGPGGGWLATQDDGTQGWFGKLFWAIATTTASNAMTYLLSSKFDISFRDLLDPTLISKLMMRYPAGFPDHWELPPNGMMQQVHNVLRAVPRQFPEKPLLLAAPTSVEQLDSLTVERKSGDEGSVKTTAPSHRCACGTCGYSQL